MAVNEFLAGLPALLGFAGFIIYQVLQHSGKPNPIVTQIVQKLRNEAPERVPDQRLSASQVGRLLREDSQLRQVITDQDYLLLRKVLNQQFWTSLFVYTICAGLFVFGMITYVRQTAQLKVAEITLSSANGDAGDQRVDLDPVVARWKIQGDSEILNAYLENIQTGERSKTNRVQASDRQISFCPSDYKSTLNIRRRGGLNRIRVVLEGQKTTFRSNEFDVHVGVLLLLVATADKISLAAMIDNQLVQGYAYEARILLQRIGQVEPFSIGGQIQGGKKDWKVPNIKTVDWPATKIVYLGPDDIKIVRTAMLIDNKIGFAPTSSNSGCAPLI
jgi:hypothetical protein